MVDLGHVLGSDREKLVAELVRAFPAADQGQSHASVVGMTIRGGRQTALERMAAIDPVTYARTRNHVAGAVSGLSPYIRHGVVSLAEVRDRAVALVRSPDDAAKFVSELGWRDYWRQVHAALGERIRDSIEPQAALPRAGGIEGVPDDVLAAATGMECIDAFVRRLHDTGLLHNHERMWLASWLVHVRGVRWQAGADWFLEHLLDGDPASNHLSWQWVAGTFSAKPYIFNRENLETFTSGVYCSRCPLIGGCDVEGDYDDLAARFFQPQPALAARQPLRIRPAAPWLPGGTSAAGRRPIVWLTLDSLSAESPAAAAHAAAPRVFIVDPVWLTEERPTLKRLAFIFECLADVPEVEVHLGDPAKVLTVRARAQGCDHVAVADTPCPRVLRAAETLATRLPVAIVDWPRFCDRSRVKDLGRFSRYWQQVSGSALVPTAKSSGV